jgi:hypothetical protein
MWIFDPFSINIFDGGEIHCQSSKLGAILAVTLKIPLLGPCSCIEMPRVTFAPTLIE